MKIDKETHDNLLLKHYPSVVLADGSVSSTYYLNYSLNGYNLPLPSEGSFIADIERAEKLLILKQTIEAI